MFRVKNIIDISRKICPEMPIWPGDEVIKVKKLDSINEGETCNLSSIELGLHTGTHIDAPFHFIQNGITIESLNLSRFLGMVKVFELSVEKCITKDSIKHLPITEGDVVFFKTVNSDIPPDSEFNREFIYIDTSAAQYLVEKKIKTVGIDYLSVDAFNSSDHSIHHIFLSREIGIIESLYLKNVNPGTYFFACLPLYIEGVEGTPARAVLVEFE